MNPITIGNGLEVWDLRNRFPGADYPGRREAGQLEYLVIHHSVTATLPEGATSEQELAALDGIDAYHRGAHGWPGIAYHFAVAPSGRRYYCVDWPVVSYHTAGEDDPGTPQVVSSHNERGLTVLLLGTFTDAAPEHVQLKSARDLLKHIEYAFGRRLPLFGHRDLWATACPGNGWDTWRPQLEAERAPDPAPVEPLGPAPGLTRADAEALEAVAAKIRAGPGGS